MTAPASAHPRSVDDLLPAARALADEQGSVPSRNAIMQRLKVGAPKATALRSALLADVVSGMPDTSSPIGELSEPGQLAEVSQVGQLPDPWEHAVPVAPEPMGSTEPDPGSTVTNVAVSAEPEQQATGDGHPGTAADVVSPIGDVATDAPASDGPDRITLAELRSLKRVRWAVRGVLALGVAASIAGNVLHARDDLISQIISAWSPLALLLTIELISRVPVHRRHLAVARWFATAVVAGIAAWVSYWHMADVASQYGESGGSQYLIPFSVDGLVVVASICLVELGGRIAAAGRKQR
ncbi:DUF2637 domain-containing protein [Verrucosispora sp. WMMD1129]|uniref:DUF2637 domain-containing protein n=1 Tax=Verrucosispora sp. WMMD1129 TaxID=3016093 RepID=UPI00249B21A6|nr:DUF2637 domain-containing protein [Verrucosispora sp. WMMD1129]WFE44260.1 DUF2637 domain-containing protein [Verrucosispora sp. WMMD1129]